MELRGKRVLITGGAVRLGRAFALALAEEGCEVCIQYWRSADAAAEVAALLGGPGRCLRADLTIPSACEEVVDRARRELGGLDVLVNSAAVFLAGDLLSTSLEGWEAHLALNLRAPFLLSQAFAARLPGGAAKIVNVTDARLRRAGVGHLAYRVSKAGLAHLTELLALELAPSVSVNAVAPGAMLPVEGESAAQLEERLRSAIPLRRVGGVEPAVAALLFLLREDFLTGVVLPVDGGEYL
jgi:glucose 1-dehydrogenase